MLKRKLFRLGTFLLYGGTQRLRGYEKEIIDHLRFSLSAPDQNALIEQLSNLDHLKRLHKDRMVTFYFFNETKLPKFGDLRDENRIAVFKLTIPKFTVLVNIISHRGLLSSFEFTKSPKPLKNELFDILFVKNAKAYESLAESIDQSEHGEN
jgi:hypothetical protein